MKKLRFALTVLSCLVVVNAPVYAGDDGSRGASSRAYERASDRSIFNRVGDWFATTGKSEAEKESILQERQERRAAKRAEKAMRKSEKSEGKERRGLDDDDSDSGKGDREKVREEREERHEERYEERHEEKHDAYREKHEEYREKSKEKGKKKKGGY